MKVLVYMSEEEDLKIGKKVKDLIIRRVHRAKGQVIFENSHEGAVKEIKDTDILFGYITPEMLKNANRLKWIQAPMASLGTPRGQYYIFPELTESEVILTNISGIFSDIIATHVFAFITCFARDFPKLIRSQTMRVWIHNTIKTINLRSKILGIIGLGGIGKEVARIGVAFGMIVVAVEPNPQNVPHFVEKIWSPGDLKELLKEADFVVLCLPDAPGTVKLIGAEELKLMKKTAYLINVGRGKTVDLDALTKALKSRWIAGAGLDVLPPDYEPLPPDHPLWGMKNVIITPHSAMQGVPSERVIDVFLENFDRYLQGKNLLNVIDKKSMILSGPGYSLPK